MRRLVLIGFILLLVPVGAWALELGAVFRAAQGSFVYKRLSGDDHYISAGTPDTYAMYLSGFPHNRFSLGGYAYLGYSWWSSGNNPNPWYRLVGLNSSFYLNGQSRSGLFLSGGAGLLALSDIKETTASVGLGYQAVRDWPFVYKVELQYSRWIDEDFNRVSLNLVLGRRFFEKGAD
ncbi:MAG: hypothetical protein OXH81_08505 [Gemmatimonadetes bacterium]|nr:hypothetical protein [Gemmatimonadota bacterium]MDE2737585.1 hypothetical protein [Gemmatimonadota bacterium]